MPVIVAITDKYLACAGYHDVRRTSERVRAVPRSPGRAETHKQFAITAELVDLVAPTLGWAWLAVCVNCIGHPDVALTVHVDPVRPHEHVGTEAPHKGPILFEQQDRIEVAVTALPSPAAFSQPDSSSESTSPIPVRMDRAARPPRPSWREPAPLLASSVRIRKSVLRRRRRTELRCDQGQLGNYPHSLCRDGFG